MLYFILGMLVVQIGFPLIDGLTGLLLTMIETVKGYFATKITRYNAEIHEERSLKNPIGFVISQEEEPDEEIL